MTGWHCWPRLARVVSIPWDGWSTIKLGWEFIQKLLRGWLDVSLLVLSDWFSITWALFSVVDGVVGFSLIYYTVFISTHEFSLCPSGSMAHPTGREKWASSCVVFSCPAGLTHHTLTAESRMGFSHHIMHLFNHRHILLFKDLLRTVLLQMSLLLGHGVILILSSFCNHAFLSFHSQRSLGIVFFLKKTCRGAMQGSGDISTSAV